VRPLLLFVAVAGCAVGGFDDTAVSSPLKGDAGGEDAPSGFGPTGSCPTPTQACAGECVDYRTSAKNCGECGRPCIDGTCTDGVCVKPEPDAGSETSGCPPGASLCGGVCIDTTADATNCGACGAKCPAGWSCSGGKCDVTCSAPKVECAGLCVDVASSAMHCGGCGKGCAVGQACVASTCVLSCTDKQTKCGDRCVDTSKDKNHCGGCDQKCGLLQFCLLGVCLP
jgi:hypothetical protein